MGSKITSGLRKRGRIWHTDKQIFGVRIRQSTYSPSKAEAQRYLARRIEEIREATIYGNRPQRIFKEAAIKFLNENQHKKSIQDDQGLLNRLLPEMGDLTLESVHMGSLQNLIEKRQKQGVKNQTVNHALQLIRHILNLAATDWVDEYGLTWLKQAPKIKLLPELNRRQPYPLSWEEQERLFAELPKHLKNMALFLVNTGCRDQEVCKLRWDWEVKLEAMPELVMFIVPKVFVKNKQDRLVLCNQMASAVIEEQRSQDPTYVFAYRGRALHHMLNHGWRNARLRAGLSMVRVHDLKHTFGRRLRAAGVSFEDRQDLLGHRSSRVTTHYSAAELNNLYEATNKVCQRSDQKMTLTVLALKAKSITPDKQQELST
ncbi:MAG: site-specific integrase [Gammaproteobacteria bacterium]|nr:site-specific integrase [Gammaproteobacteria bacterium]